MKRRNKMYSCFFFTAVTKSFIAWYQSQSSGWGPLFDMIISFCPGWVFLGTRVLWACWEPVPGTPALRHRVLGVGGKLGTVSWTSATVRPGQMQIHMLQNTYFQLMYLSIHTGQKRMCTTVYYTTMSTTHTTMSSTPCSALLTVTRLKPRCTQHLLTRRYFSFICSVLL